jgi:hypothetical protein
MRRLWPTLSVVFLLSGCVTPVVRSSSVRHVRRELFAALTPSKLTNCELRRYGDERDGGYLLCENLVAHSQVAYSYGIDGRDQWGCDVSQQLGTTVHEYDCFNLTRPGCQKGTFTFHEECIGEARQTLDGRPYDTLPEQLARNGDADTRLIVKMDVEGSEWASLIATPDSVLEHIDQLVIELHGTDDPSYVAMVKKLNRLFYVVHFHANNNACMKGIRPFTAWANEVLFVNKRIGVPDPNAGPPTLPNPLDAPNSDAIVDCQPVFGRRRGP